VVKITIKNWAEFQHYKDRNPPWIKLHKKLLDDYEFYCLPDASRALAPMLWLLASESKDGIIEGSWESIAFRLHTTPQKAESACKPLIEKGFIERDSNALAPRKQVATPETETEREKEAEIDSAPAERPKRATPFLDGFELDADMIQFANEHAVDPVKEFAAFRDYHKSRGNAFKDWVAAWRTWVRNAVKFNGGKGNGRPADEPKSFDRARNEGTDAALRRILERGRPQHSQAGTTSPPAIRRDGTTDVHGGASRPIPIEAASRVRQGASPVEEDADHTGDSRVSKRAS
jgi:hypothetical protein